MKRILIFSGTTEGRQLADILDASGICADVCVATGYGHEVMTEGQYRNIYTGRLTEEEMKEFMQKGDYAAIVDATHPYAVVVSSNIRQASAQAGLPYYRLRRTLQSAGDDSDVIYVKSQQECVRALEQTSGNILLTTGSKELHCYCENEALRERLFVRVLPGTESIEICHKNGILGRQIIAMQGPFSEEMNLARFVQSALPEFPAPPVQFPPSVFLLWFLFFPASDHHHMQMLLSYFLFFRFLFFHLILA